MDFDLNRKSIEQHKDKNLYLLDSGVFVVPEEIASVCEQDLLKF
jgi:hypothetical protein